MSSSGLEIHTRLEREGETREVWLTAIPGMQPGRRVRIQAPVGQQWWRIDSLGTMRLREATSAVELAGQQDQIN